MIPISMRGIWTDYNVFLELILCGSKTHRAAYMYIKGESMNSQLGKWAQVDENGRLVIPPDVTARFGLEPGAQVRIEEGKNDIRLHRPVMQLAKIYLEPTNVCNLACRMCMRNMWDEPSGRMSKKLFRISLIDCRICQFYQVYSSAAWGSRFLIPGLWIWSPSWQN